MAADDREHLFEKALARHLRQSAPPDSSALPSTACADAETLAAYHERLLPLEELHRWKQHLVACERCREILAQLELSEELPLADLAADSVQDLVSADPGARLPAATSFDVSPAGAAPLAAPTPSASPPKTIPIPSRRRYWQWVAPAGAIAAGLLIWITWHENRPLSLTAPPASSRHQELARTAPPSETPLPSPALKEQSNASQRERDSASLAASSAPPAAFLDKKKALDHPENEIARNKPDAAETNANSGAELRSPVRPRSSVAQPPAAGPSSRAFQQQSAKALQQNAPRQSELQLSPDVTAGIPQTKQESAAPSANAPLTAAKVAPAPPPAPPAKLAAPKPAPADSAARQQEAAEQKDSGRLARPRTGIAAESTQPLAAMDYTSATVAPSGARLIPAPGRKVVWKIDENGAVARSTDSSETWQPQDTGATSRLRAGSAPSDSVCWLAGDFGTVVLTTDGGAHWTAVTPPSNSAITEIVAADARVATVTLQFSKIRFMTSDGGQTWHPVKR